MTTTTTTETRQFEPAEFVGLFFLVWDDKHEHLARQGRIIGKVTDTMFLAQYYNEITGPPDIIYVVPVEEMVAANVSGKWEFFRYDEECRYRSSIIRNRYNPERHYENYPNSRPKLLSSAPGRGKNE
jgi:hypothetical protein